MEPWNEQKQTVAILIPHGELVYFPFALALTHLNPPQPSFFILQRGLSLHELRDYMVDVQFQTQHYDTIYMDIMKNKDAMIEKSLDSGADYIFFLDSDVIVPPNTIQTLMQWHYPITAGVYWKKVNKTHTSLYMYDENSKKYNAIEKYKAPRTMFVDGIGMGITLIDTRIFKKLSQPWFWWEHYKVNKDRLSEDLYFCKKVWDELGIKILVDTYVTGEHIGMGGVRNNGELFFPDI
ncbi:MAG: hypothetical protein QXH07_05160 [Thermoplasmata archaeon]